MTHKRSYKIRAFVVQEPDTTSGDDVIVMSISFPVDLENPDHANIKTNMEYLLHQVGCHLSAITTEQPKP